MTTSSLSFQKACSRKWLITIFLAISIASKSIAGVDPPVSQLLDGSLGQVVKNGYVMVEDAKFFDPAYYTKLNKPYPLKNVVSLEIIEDKPLFITDSFTVRLRLGIDFVRNDSTSGYEERVFTVRYYKNSEYENKHVYIFNNCARVTVTVIDTFRSVTWNAYGVVKVVNQLQSMPNYEWECSENVIEEINDSAWAPNTDKDELPVFWAPVIGADEYDLEWTYIDSSALSSGRYVDSANPDPNLLFDNNASRITITGSYYAIPIIYDNKGHLFYRVRPVQWQGGGGRNEANWSSDYVDGLGHWVYNGHERSLNWQATTTYAEEGKRKIVIQYFDGSLRGRQTVTKDNSTNTTVVAESFYDYQGRPVIQVLPAPTVNTILQYNQAFNVGINGNIYDKFNYDTLANLSDYGGLGAKPFDTVSGAARYYSPYNELVDSNFNKYIPRSDGFPFTEVEFTQDNTGRVSRQSGVGKVHRLGSDRETKYYYSTADQRELDALFGTEVGNESHYFKTSVRDANGQYSVSYTDMHGRVIATALAGLPPDSSYLDPLSSHVSVKRTERLSSPEATVIKDLVMESKKSLLVTKKDTLYFHYELRPDSLVIDGCSMPVCYDCLYDLEITITDDRNNTKLGNQPFVTAVRNFSLGNIDTSRLTQNVGFEFSFEKELEEGNYEVTKKLSVSKRALEYFRDTVFMATNACKSLDSFIVEQRALLASILQCQPTCETCTDSLGTWEEFWERYKETTGIEDSVAAEYETMARAAHSAALEECRLLCKETSELDDIRRNMLMDVTPSGGQYANVADTNNIYSVFYSTNTGNTADSAAPYQRVEVYLDENGHLDSVYDESSGALVKPNRLSPEVFAEKFKTSWAESLLRLHPEYCKLRKYEELKESHEWDRKFAAVDTWQEAKDKGYLNPTNNGGPPFSYFNGTSSDVDPMSTFDSHLFRDRLEDSLEAFRTTSSGAISMWSVAAISALCGSEECFETYADPSFAESFCAGGMDMAWRAFRQFYLDVKRNIQMKWLADSCSTSVSPITLMTAGYQPHFADARQMLAANGVGIISDSTGIQQKMNDQYAATCTGYATLWWNQLRPCGFSTADSARIVSRLVQICREGSDIYHPYGASSIKPSSGYDWNDFNEFLIHYADSVGKPYDQSCNAFLLSAPKPYETQAANGNKPLYHTPDSCECDQIAAYYEKFQESEGYFSFSAYMQGVYNTTIDSVSLFQLRLHCGLVPDLIPYCDKMLRPINLPPAFQCNVGDVCISCDQFESLKLEFQVAFPGAAPAPSDDIITDSTHIKDNQLFADFMNYKTGYSITAYDYFNFANQCQVGLSGDDCDTLRQWIKDFKLAHAASYGVKVDFVSQEAEHFDDLHEIIQDSAIQLPDTVRARPGSSYNGVSFTQLGSKNFCWSDGYAIEFRFRYIQSLLAGHSFYLSFGNFGAIFTRYTQTVTVQGHTMPPGLYITKLTDIHGNSYGGDNFPWFGFNHRALDSIDVNALLNWNTLKLKMSTDSMIIYWNGVAKLAILRNPANLTINNYSTFTLGLRGRHGNVDWLKMYDANGQVRYFEDFNNPDEPAIVDHDFLCPTPAPSCQSAFVTYFNTRKGTSYTFNQIDSVYQANCSYGANPCGGEPPVVSTNLTLCGTAEPVFELTKLDPVDNCSDSTFFIQSVAHELYKVYIDSLKNRFDSAYKAKCLEAYKFENFTVRRNVSEFHHTLYYYDQAGNLLKTIPPSGVRANYDSLWLDSVQTARSLGNVKTPKHELPTQYRYNTLNQVVAQRSPDSRGTEFWYDRLGRLVLSRNAKQKGLSAAMRYYFSFTRYDHLGRITQVGQIREAAQNSAVDDALTRDEGALQTWFAAYNLKRHELTQTVYDEPYFTGAYSPLTMVQRNLRNRVSYVTLRSDTVDVTNAYHNGIFYTYDIMGNVDTLLNDYGYNGMDTLLHNMMNRNGNRWKKIVYNYDLISGKVNTVAYQRGYHDQFFQRYLYDAENRLILAESSRDSVIWEREATYQYYKHGPLARTVLGHQQVQGIDYAYTLQGWLKGINSTAGTATRDMGGDGLSSGVNQYTARDAIGISLDYFAGDYSAIKPGEIPFPGVSAGLNTAHRPLYNGNISSMSVYNRRLGDVGAPGGALLLYNYRYDQLNRITAMDVYNDFNTSGNDWNSADLLTMMRERVSYDANGNILNYRRNAANGNVMDKLAYSYYAGTNQLRQVTDSVPDGDFPGADIIFDIDNQTEADNYIYDSIGNLIQDKKEQINSITWNVYGKITSISRNSTGGVSVTTIKYFYDALGNRIGKVFDLGGNKRYTWYVRDAQGNVMSIYDANPEGDPSLQNLNITQVEQYLYGSSRLGFLANAQPVDNGNAGPGTMEFYNGGQVLRGKRSYELTNHLGNVLAVVTDKKFGVSSGGSLNDYYNPEIVSATDYYPFGMAARVTVNLTNYTRFGFNGKEFDWEVKGWQNQYDYGFRIYDPRIGRFLSVDPHAFNYSDLSPYNGMGNNPINYLDPDGRDIVYFNISGEEVYRVKSSTEFRTFIQSTTKIKPPAQSLVGWKEVPMPKIIQERTQSKEITTGTEYQEQDYIIAARTGLFNQTKNYGKLQLFTESGDPIPKEEAIKIPDLDPTMVKAASIQESNNGVGGNMDLLTANNPGDYDKYKEAYGLSKDEKVTDPERSLYFGIRFIATKGFRDGITYDKTTGLRTYKFQGWLRAFGNYNGFGIERVNGIPTKNWKKPSLYEKYIKAMVDNSITPTPKNY